MIPDVDRIVWKVWRVLIDFDADSHVNSKVRAPLATSALSAPFEFSYSSHSTGLIQCYSGSSRKQFSHRWPVNSVLSLAKLLILLATEY